jgi:hypothetical protein
MFTFKVNDTIYDLPEDKVADFKATYPDAVEITDEIQTTSTEGKTSDVATVDAAVTSEPDTASESTGLNSENYFSVPPSEILEQGKFVRTEEGVRFAEEGEIILAEPEKGLVAPIMLDEFDIIEYKKQQQQDENQAAREIMLSVTGLSEPTEDEIQEQKAKEGELKPITEFEEAQRISKGQIEFRKQAEERAKRIAEGSEFLSYQENIANNVANGLRLLTSVDDNARWLWYWAGSQDSDLLRNMYGNEKAEEILAKNRTGLAKATADIDAINAMQAPTIGFTDLPERKGSEYIPGFGLVDSKITGGVSAAIGAVTQTGASIGLQVGTGGVGLASTMIAESVKDYNETKANELGINLEDLVFSGEAETFVPAALGALSYGLEKLPNNKILDYIKSIPTSSRRQMVSFMNTVGANGFQEIGQLGIETFNTGLAEGKTVGEAGAAAGRVMVSKEGFEAGLQGAFGSAGLALSGRSLKASGSIRTDSENKRIQNYIDQISSLENSKFQKNITAEEIGVINTAQQEIKNNIVEEVNKNNILVASFTDDQLETVNKNTDFLTESASKINETEASTDLSRQDKDIIINAIEQSRNRASQEIYNIRNEAEAFVGDLRKARKATETLQDVEIKDFKTTEEINKFLEDQDQNIDTKASEQQAFVIQNPETGKQTVVINRSLAGKEAIKHEVGHVLLYETVKNRPETAINLGNALLSELDKIDAAQIKDSNFKKRMEQYSDQTREVQMEEAITLFSDAINTGDIKFEENIFTKLGDRVRRVMQRFGVKIKFNNGRDVYNFVKDYNKSIEKGGLSIAQVRAAAKGVEGELVTPATEQQTEQIIKESRTEEQTERNKDLMQRAKEGDVLAANDLVKENSGLILRLLKFNPDTARQSGVTSDDILQAVTDMMTPGMVDITFPGRKKSLVEEYKESDGEVSTFLGRLGQRQAEIYTAAGLDPNKFTTERIDAPEARQVAAEEVVTETAVKPEAKAIDPFRIMPDVKETATAEVQKSIADKDVDVTEVTYKELKDVAPYQTVADFFNIPVSRIRNPKDNLRKSDDVANIQRWILKNEPTLKNLFTEANRDVIEVTEGNRVIRQGGEPTAIPRNLLNKFYTKGDRIGNNFQWKLKPYDRTTFLEAVGIRDGKVDPNFTPRAAEAQTIKGILDMYTRNLGNVAARDIIEGREDITPAERARVKAEVAKGKPRLMFAKSGIALDMNNTVKKAGGKVLENTIEDNQTFRTFLVDELTKFLGSETNRIIKPSDIAGAGNSAIGNKKTSGAKGRGFRFIGDINKTQRFIKETEAAIAAGEVMDLQVLRNEIKDKANLLSEEQVQDIIAATSSQTKASMVRNETNKNKIKRGKRLILDALFRAVQADINNLGPIRELLYNANANSSFGRKFATVTSIENNLKPKQKTWEEHVFQFGNWANRTLEAYGTKDPNIVNGWLKWAENNYYQEVTGRDTQGIVDGVYPGWKAKFEEHPYLKEKLDEAFKTGDFSQVPPSDIRKYNEFFTIDPNVRSRDGITDAERYNVAVNKKFQSNPNVIAEQGKLIYQQFTGEIDAKQAQNQIKEYVKIANSETKASIGNNNENNTIKFSKQVPNQEILDNLGNADQAMANARNPEAPVKKIRVFDFDDTLARSNSNVLYEMPDGTEG